MARISSLLQKPDKSGTPANAAAPQRKVQRVTGSRVERWRLPVVIDRSEPGRIAPAREDPQVGVRIDEDEDGLYTNYQSYEQHPPSAEVEASVGILFQERLTDLNTL